MMVTSRFNNVEGLITKANVDTQVYFAQREELAMMGDFPTLAEVNIAFGNNASAQWLSVQLADLTLYTGAKNINKRQQDQLAQIITAQFYWMKITELLLFFHRFKSGRYGHFFGNVDPLVIMEALRIFVAERNDIIHDVEERERKEREAAEQRENPPISYEEWKRIKAERENNAHKAT